MKKSYIQVRVPDELKEKFYEKCEKEGRTPSRLIRAWIEEYIKGAG